MERDNAIPQRRPRTFTSNPLFLSKEREPLPYGIKVYNEEAAGESGSESSSSRGLATTSASARPRGGWLSGKNRRPMGLGEAFRRTDDNGGLRPRTAPGILRDDDAGEELAPSPESRVPRSTTYSSGTPLGSSPPVVTEEIYARAEREESGMPVPEDNGSESSGLLEGSPSPAPNPRNTRYIREEIRRRVVPRNKELDDIEFAHIDRARERLERTKARMKRSIANPQPLFPAQDPVDTQAPFSRRSRLARRTSTSSEEVGARHKPSNSSFEDEPDPPYNVPKAWTRAKPLPNYIQKSFPPEDLLKTKDPLVLSEDHSQHVPADVPLPSVELGASAQPTSPRSQPTPEQPSADFQERSPEKSRLWDADLDFTARSIQLSTSPMLRVKPTSKLDDIREQEIQSLSARAIANNRLEEIRERNSEERSMNEETQIPNSAEEPKEEIYHERTILEEEGYPIPGTPVTVFPYNSYPSRPSDPPGHKREDSFETLRKLARVLSQSPAPSHRRAEDGEKEGNPAEIRADKERDDEHVPSEDDFARASESPRGRSIESPKQPETVEPVEKKPAEKEPDQPAGRLMDRINGLSLDYSRSRSQRRRGFPMETKRRRTTCSPSKSDVDPEERITAEAKLFELQDHRSEKNSIEAPSRSPSLPDDGHPDETPRPKADPLSLPTPRVTGAFIETPAPSVRRPQKQRSISPSDQLVDPVDDALPSSENEQQLSSKENSTCRTAAKKNTGNNALLHSSAHVGQQRTQVTPRGTSLNRENAKRKGRASGSLLVNTAKVTTAAEDLRRLEIEAGIDDSTLDNFETLLEHGTAYKESIREKSGLDPVSESLDEDDDILSTVAERERRIERLIWARMEQKLRNTSTSIRDAKHGIERLEQQVSSASAMPANPVSGDNAHHVRIQIDMKFPRLWVKNPVAVSEPGPRARGRLAGFGKRRNWKFTWLGAILAMFAAWYVAESFMCGIYCHPVASSKNTWQPSDPFFPWAIPTKLDQWTGEIVSSAARSAKESLDNWRDPEGLRYKRLHYHPGVNGGANDWWLGRSGPAGIVRPEKEAGSMFEDEAYD
ncbi:hypothetical protein BUE80_DR000658 [Diplocarpon rosae]|nr:hypothetical protein BUE80_DR000658 [Diplocarpon rosae]